MPAPANTTDDVVWSSDAEEFATVSESGLVTAVAAGTAKISATYGSVSATCTVHVSEPDPEFEVISFETREGMLDAAEMPKLNCAMLRLPGTGPAVTLAKVLCGKESI